LRVASAELKGRLDVPYQVVLSEYVDLAEAFGATEAHQFINAVLDRLSKDYRPLEQGIHNDTQKTEKTQVDPLTDF
jgi:N utilization substance protein B